MKNSQGQNRYVTTGHKKNIHLKSTRKRIEFFTVSFYRRRHSLTLIWNTYTGGIYSLLSLPLLFSSWIMRPFLTNIITTLNSSFRTKAETVRSCAAIFLLSAVRLWPQMYSCQKLSPIINSAVCKSNWEIKRFHLTDCAGER